ncbi:MAG TPA: hypothetical protein VFF02_06410 [Anaeromyxobacteraceae bacterium]|nr:hypothetical protein [Anaeromyxobacteraceae bacterium]
MVVLTVSRALTLAIALALAAGVARADAPGPPIAADQLSTRSLAMAAMRGLAAGTDAIWLNPGAIAARRRYAAELQWQLDQHSTAGNASFYGVSVVDAQTSSVAGGFAYTRVDVPGSTGNRWNLALAGEVAKGLFIGVSGEYLILYGTENVKTGNLHAGLLWEVADIVSVGLAGTNLVPTGHPDLTPTGAAAGISVGSDRSFHLAADWLLHWDASGAKRNTWAAGAEVLIGDLVPVRAGLTKDEWRGGQWWSAGAGVVTSSGVALDLAYRQAIRGGSNRVFAAGLKVFLFN